MPSSEFPVAHVYVSQPLAAVVLVFSIVLCLVLALNSWAVESKVCISAAKYEHSPFFWKPC